MIFCAARLCPVEAPASDDNMCTMVCQRLPAPRRPSANYLPEALVAEIIRLGSSDETDLHYNTAHHLHSLLQAT